MRDAYVGRIDVAIDVEKAGIAVTLLADGIREPANGEQVGRAIERDAVLEAQALSCENLVRNRLQPLVGDSKFAHCASSTDFSLCSSVSKKNQPTQAEACANCARRLLPRPRTAETRD